MPKNPKIIPKESGMHLSQFEYCKRISGNLEERGIILWNSENPKHSKRIGNNAKEPLVINRRQSVLKNHQ